MSKTTVITLAPLGPIISRAMAYLAERRNEWPDPASDEMVTLVCEAMERHVPTGGALWALFRDDPNMGNIGGPDAMAPTIEEVVRDAIKEQIEPSLYRWADAVFAAETAS